MFLFYRFFFADCLVSEITSHEESLSSSSGSEEESATSSSEDDDDDDNDDDDDDDDENMDDSLLYENADITVSSFSYLLLLFSIKHNLSEKAKEDLLDVFNAVLPNGNLCPSSASKLNKLTNGIKNNHHQIS